nr:mobilome CxxCx(11)CxxC protein [Planosporangium mesophilum]
MNSASAEDSLRQECWTNAIHAYGTSYVFQQRQRRLKRAQLWITYSGIIIPLLMGAILLSFGLKLPGLSIMIAGASVLLIGQLALSTWSALAGWTDQLAYANESVVSNESLSRRFADLGRTPPKGTRFRTEFDLLRTEDSARRDQDLRQHLTEKELRMGMRAALRQFERKCATCGQVPTSMKATDCDTCGKF